MITYVLSGASLLLASIVEGHSCQGVRFDYVSRLALDTPLSAKEHS